MDNTGVSITDYELLNEGATMYNGQLTFRGKLYEYVSYDSFKHTWVFRPVEIDEIDPLQMVYRVENS